MGDKEKKTKLTAGDRLAAALAILLYGNFLMVLLFAVFAMGKLLLEPIFPLGTGGLALFGLIGLPASRRLGVGKLWRRLLLGAVAGTLLIITLYCFLFAAMVLAWQ